MAVAVPASDVGEARGVLTHGSHLVRHQVTVVAEVGLKPGRTEERRGKILHFIFSSLPFT